MIPVSNLGVNFQSRSLGIKLEEKFIEKFKKRHNHDIADHSILKKFFLR